jgi:hypothetical protein
MLLFSHLLREAFGKLTGALGVAILFAAIGAGAVLGYGYSTAHSWPPSAITVVLAVVIGGLAGYAAATTAILRAIAQTVLGATKAVERESEKVLKA